MHEIWSQNIIATNKQNSNARNIARAAKMKQRMRIQLITYDHIVERFEKGTVSVETVETVTS